MKKIALALSALVLVFGMSQCKKNMVGPTDNGLHTYNITINTDGGSRVGVTPSTGAVDFENNDVLYVAYNGKYVGKITHNGSAFTGSITTTAATGNGPLYFYFLGNAKPAETLTSDETASCSVVISDQASSLPVISFGESAETFTGDGPYTSNLANKCALVKFNVTKADNGTDYNMGVCITGVNNKVTVSFASPTGDDNGFSYSQNGNGDISFVRRSDGDYWAIMLPNASAQAAGAEGTAFSGHFKGSRPELPALEAGRKYGEGIDMTVNTPYCPDGAINAMFSVAADKQVMFSQANLKATTADSWSTWTWSFMTNQYDRVETSSVNDNYAGSNEVSLFGWGTSGYNHGATCYKPNSTSYNYEYYYAYGDYNKNLHDGNGTADWGYNNISNGGDGYKQWRTLTTGEWQYLLGVYGGTAGTDFRDGVRFLNAHITVGGNDYYGLIVFPDGFDNSGYSYTNWNEFYESAETVNDTDWASMESAGAVFLPAAGDRYGTGVDVVGYFGFYWSSSAYDEDYAWGVYFYYDNVYPGNDGRYYGQSVRLVR